MQEFFQAQRQRISDYLDRYQQEKRGDLSRVNQMGAEAMEKLHRFALRGKMIRGGLVGLAYLLFSEEGAEDQPQEVITAGAAMEFFQSAFLVHDDIMDRDQRRRGADTVFYEFVREAEEKEIRDAYHTGEALGICAGDIAFFLAFQLLGTLRSAPARELTNLCARELAYVGVAQMVDVYWGQRSDGVDQQAVLDLYTYKTGRYTFSLPLMCGAILTGASEENRRRLERIGELLGVVFQLKDDELGLFGDAQKLGKAVGSDIKEGKKTPFFTLLQERVSAEEREKLEQIFGSEHITDQEVQYVRDLVEQHGVRATVNEMCTSYAEQARELITSLEGARDQYRQVFIQLLEYSLHRSF